MSTTMKYSGYTFSPTPLMSMEKVFNRTDDGAPIGTDINVTLEGTLVAITNGEGSIEDLDSKMDALRWALSYDHAPFKIWCTSESTPWFSGRPRITSLTFNPSPDNWVFTAPYVVQLSFIENEPFENYNTYGGHYIQSVNETLNFQAVNDYSPYKWQLEGYQDGSPQQYRLEHNISAVGKRSKPTGGGTEIPGYIHAKNFVESYYTFDIAEVATTGMFNVVYSWLTGLNHIRATNCDVYNGVYSLNESWTYFDTGGPGLYLGNAIEDFTVNIVKGTNDDLMRVNVEGSIQGLESRRPSDYQIISTKYQSASGYWANAKLRIFPRVQYLASGEGNSSRDINIYPVVESVAHNPVRGTITYNYEYNDRPYTCNPDAYQETISVTDSKPADVFATLVVLGRTNGPILQDIGTKTAGVRTLSIDAIISPTETCPTNAAAFSTWLSDSPASYYDTFVNAMESRTKTDHGQTFRSNDSETWDGSNGRYSRSVSWTYSNC